MPVKRCPPQQVSEAEGFMQLILHSSYSICFPAWSGENQSPPNTCNPKMQGLASLTCTRIPAEPRDPGRQQEGL